MGVRAAPCLCLTQTGRLRLDDERQVYAELVCEDPDCAKTYPLPEQTTLARAQAQFHLAGQPSA